MRIRTVKPEFWTDESLSSLPYDTRLLAIGLLNYSDDEGYFLADPRLIRGVIFPFEDTSKNIPRMLSELSGIGYIRIGKCENGKELGHVVKFKVHQRVDKPKQSNLAKNSQFQDSSKIDQGSIQDASKEEWKGNGMELERNGIVLDCKEQDRKRWDAQFGNSQVSEEQKKEFFAKVGASING